MGSSGCVHCGAVDQLQRRELLGLKYSAAGFCAVVRCLHRNLLSIPAARACYVQGIRAGNGRTLKTPYRSEYPGGSGIKHPCGFAAGCATFSGVHPRGSGSVLWRLEVVGFVGFPRFKPRDQKRIRLEFRPHTAGLNVSVVHQCSPDKNGVPSGFAHAPVGRRCDA